MGSLDGSYSKQVLNSAVSDISAGLKLPLLWVMELMKLLNVCSEKFWRMLNHNQKSQKTRKSNWLASGNHLRMMVVAVNIPFPWVTSSPDRIIVHLTGE